jgi:hypothetical protein
VCFIASPDGAAVMPKYLDGDGRERWTYVVYVIELDRTACSDRRAKCGGCGRTPVYVGQTALSPEERFEQHRAGVRSSQWVRKYGKWIRRRLAPRLEFATQPEALLAEAATGRRLAAKGFCVYGAH